MQRTITNKKPVREEWTKYFVNNIECKRDEILKTIIKNKFCNEIKLSKKYHFKFKEEKTQIDKEETRNDEQHEYSCSFSRNTSKHSQENNRNAHISLETKKFIDKFKPTSDEFKTLIKKMTHALDQYDAAIEDYQKNSDESRQAARDLFLYFIRTASACASPYDDILSEFSSEYFTFLFDTLACVYSKLNEDENNTVKKIAPHLEFDTSEMKEKWDDSLTNDKKSQFLKKYFAVMLKQTEVVFQVLKKSGVLPDKTSMAEVKNKFNDFKKLIKTTEKKRYSLDDVYSLSKKSTFATFFHVKEASQQEKRETRSTLKL